MLAEEDALAASATTEQAGRPALDPTLGAIRVSADWKQSVFLLVAEDERTVVELPAPTRIPYGSDAGWVPPPGYGPVGLWTELPPGRYVLIAGSPGKRLAEAAVEILAGKEVWLNADLEPEESRIKVSHPVEKIGPTWHKPELLKAGVKWRVPNSTQRVEKRSPGSG